MSSLNIFITGSTDGIGLETARKLKSLGHNVLVHGRNPTKLKNVSDELGVKTFQADFSSLEDVKKLAGEMLVQEKKIDILINNAGVFKTPHPRTSDGFDTRYVVNTFAPYLLTKLLLPIISKEGRIINLSSAAQNSVDFKAMLGKTELSDYEAYAQSKLAITMWSRYLASELSDGPTVIAVNPGSLLATKMVKEGFDIDGKDINIGVDILTSLSLDESHKAHSGEYYDTDNGKYAAPDADGLDEKKTKELILNIKKIVEKYL